MIVWIEVLNKIDGILESKCNSIKTEDLDVKLIADLLRMTEVILANTTNTFVYRSTDVSNHKIQFFFFSNCAHQLFFLEINTFNIS